MKLNRYISDRKFQVAVTAALGLFLAYRVQQTGKAVGEVVADTVDSGIGLVNPADRRNIIYRTINAGGDVLDDGSQDDSFRLGSWFYDVTHPNEFEHLDD